MKGFIDKLARLLARLDLLFALDETADLRVQTAMKRLSDE